MKNILVIHGPNLNLLGEREPEIYGEATLDDIDGRIEEFALDLGLTVRIFQSNHEGKIIDCIHDNRDWAGGIVINPGAYTHYSHAIADALKAVNLPAVEVHLTDIHGREPFRGESVIERACVKQIFGEGPAGYIEAVKTLLAESSGSKIPNRS